MKSVWFSMRLEDLGLLVTYTHAKFAAIRRHNTSTLNRFPCNAYAEVFGRCEMIDGGGA